MRTAALLVLVVATLACGSEPAPRPASDAAGILDASDAAPDPCVGVSCLPGSVCSLGACILAPVDASAPDASAEVGVDAAPEAAVDAPGDDTPEVSPGCRAPATMSCVTPGFGAGCWDLLTSNNQPRALNCGACGRSCPEVAPRCVGGRCSE